MSSTLTDLMRDSTDNLTVHPSFTDAVLRGGRRRQLRRRSAMTVTVGVIGLACAGAMLQGLPTSGPTGFADGQPTPRSSPLSRTQGGVLADGRTHGDLAGDSAYLAAVRRVWSDWMAQQGAGYEHPRGEALVVWAGTTPAGPAALLQQEIDLPRKHGATEPGRYATLGFIGVGPSGPRVVTGLHNADVNNSLAWYVDDAHRTLVVTDNNVTRGVSFGWQYAGDGHRSRVYRTLTFRDGATIVTLPTGVSRTAVAVSDLPQGGTPRDVPIALDLDGAGGEVNGLAWADPRGGLSLPLAGGSTLTPKQAAEGYYDVRNKLEGLSEGSPGRPGRGLFLIHGTTPNGTEVRIIQDQLDGDQAHLYLTYGDVLRHLGVADPTAVLPVRTLLPDGQGWVVARHQASLRYRVGSGPWIRAHDGAALLPAVATAVEVTPAGGTATIVTLT